MEYGAGNGFVSDNSKDNNSGKYVRERGIMAENSRSYAAQKVRNFTEHFIRIV